MILNSPYITGSLTVTGNATIAGNITVTGSLSGTAATSSFALTLQGTGSVGFATTGAFSATSGSASSRLTQIEQVYATTGSNSFRATQSITGSLTVTGQIIAQTLNVQQVTSSIVYSSGSNTFGCDLNSRQTFTGSFYQTGSVAVFSNNIGVGITPEFSLDINGDIALTRTQKVQFTGATPGDRNRAFIGGTPNNDLLFAVAAGVCTFKLAYTGESCFSGTTCVPNFYANGCINVLSGNSINLTSNVGSVNGLFGQINAGYGTGGVQNAASIEFQRSALSWGDNGDIVFKTNPGGGTITERMRITNIGQVGIGTCSPQSQFVIGKSGNNATLELNLNNNGYSRIFSYDRTAAGPANLILQDTGCKLGIGITCPSNVVHIQGTSDQQLKIDVDAGGSYSSINFARNTSNVAALAYAHNANEFQVPYTNCSCAYIAMYTGAGNKSVMIDKNGVACFSGTICSPNKVVATAPRNFQWPSKTFSSGGATCFSMGSDYGLGLGDNISGLFIISINQTSSAVELNSAVYIGTVNNPRGAGSYVQTISCNTAGSQITSFIVCGGAANYIYVQATSASGANLRATMAFIGGGGTA